MQATREFNPKTDLPKDKSHFFSIVSGVRRSGKTVCTQALLKGPLHKRFHHTILISGTLELHDQKEYFPTIPKSHRYTDGQLSEVLHRVIEIQEQAIKKNRGKAKDILIVADDVLDGSTRVKNSKALTKLATLGRHLKVSVVMLVQHLVSGCNTAVRANADLLFVFPTSSLKVLRFLTEEYLHYGSDGTLASKRNAYEILHGIWTKDQYTCIVICSHLIGGARSIRDFVFSYKAPL